MENTENQYVKFELTNGIVIFTISCEQPVTFDWMFYNEFKKPAPGYTEELAQMRNPVLSGKGVLTSFEFHNTPYIIKDIRLEQVFQHFENNNLFIEIDGTRELVSVIDRLGNNYVIKIGDEIYPIDLDTISFDENELKLVVYNE